MGSQIRWRMTIKSKESGVLEITMRQKQPFSSDIFLFIDVIAVFTGVRACRGPGWRILLICEELGIITNIAHRRQRRVSSQHLLNTPEPSNPPARERERETV